MNKLNDIDAAKPPGIFALPGQAVVTLTGRDALAFAQAQFMSDIAELGDGHWQWSGWLTPKGRLIAVFAGLRLDAETLWLLLPDADAGDFAARLQGFVFRSKLAIAVRNDLKVSGTFATPAAAKGAHAAIGDEGRVQLDLGGEGGRRTLWITSDDAPRDPDAHMRWMREDLAHGLPRLPPTQLGQWTPQQLSLERLRAYSVKKGCYPGQEIVARTHFLGQAKRGLVRLRGKGVAALADVLAADAAIGKMVCAAGDEGLAVLPLDTPTGSMMTGGATCERLPLLDGLAR